VSALAKAYAAFVGENSAPGAPRRLNPSGYAETQGAFTRRLRDEVAARRALPCRLELGTHTEFSEPPVRIDTDFLDAERLGWSESQAWDEFVAFYAPSFGGGCKRATSYRRRGNSSHAGCRNREITDIKLLSGSVTSIPESSFLKSLRRTHCENTELTLTSYKIIIFRRRPGG